MERSDFPVFYPIITRWMDNDIYGHVNNVTYYSYFDSVINRYLIEEGGLDIHNAPVVGFMVSSSCQFKKPDSGQTLSACSLMPLKPAFGLPELAPVL